MTTPATPDKRLIVDWSAAVRAGFVAGIVFIGAELLYSLFAGAGGPLNPSIELSAGTVILGLVMHFALSVAFACLIAFCLHRWGILVGIVGGALFGLGLYYINAFLFSLLFDWFFPAGGWDYLVAHLLYGATAGGVYEWLEVENYVSV